MTSFFKCFFNCQDEGGVPHQRRRLWLKLASLASLGCLIALNSAPLAGAQGAFCGDVSSFCPTPRENPCANPTIK